MKSQKTLIVAGGDERQIYLAGKLADEYNIIMTGFDRFDGECQNVSLCEIPDNTADGLILPVLVSADDITVNAPCSSEKIMIDSLIRKIRKDGSVYGGKFSSALAVLFENSGINVFDYSLREEFSILNAVATAEGALQTALDNSDELIFCQKILVTGFGRISKTLIKILNGMGADVTVSARKKSDMIWAEFYGCHTISIRELKEKISGFGIIFNTVPSLLFDRAVFENMRKNVLFIDLASKPGGAVFN